MPVLGEYVPVADLRSAASLPYFDPDWKRLCLTCKHSKTVEAKVKDEKNKTTMLRCSLSQGGSAQGPIDNSCINLRTLGGQCGPSAALWKPRQEQ